MKAIRIHAYGAADQMRLDDAPIPACGVNDVLVRVVTAGVNPVDWKIRSSAMANGLPKSFPMTLGSDAAGVVAAVGGDLSAVAVQLAERVDAGQLRVRVGQEFALADAAQAHRLGESGQARGKMTLQVGAPQR